MRLDRLAIVAVGLFAANAILSNANTIVPALDKTSYGLRMYAELPTVATAFDAVSRCRTIISCPSADKAQESLEHFQSVMKDARIPECFRDGDAKLHRGIRLALEGLTALKKNREGIGMQDIHDASESIEAATAAMKHAHATGCL
jgi:hypothetical protein